MPTRGTRTAIPRVSPTETRSRTPRDGSGLSRAKLAARSGPRLLPPASRARDWVPAGLGAGLCLGAVEALALTAEGIELGPGTALALVAADALAVGVPATLVGVGVRLSGRRIRHSTLVGAMVGPLLAARVLPRALSGGPPEPELLAGLALAALAGFGAGFAGSRLERGGVPISGPPLWTAVSLLVAAGGALRPGGPLEATPGVLAALAGAVIVLALLAAFLAVFGSRRDSVAPWPWSRTLVSLALAAAGVALAPRLLPWLLMDPPSAAARPHSPSVIVLDLGTFAPDEAPALGGEDPSANLTILASGGILYRRFLLAPGDGTPGGWLALPGGLSVARALEARGYGVRAVVPGTVLPPGFGRPLRTRPDDALRSTVGGALLARVGADRSGEPTEAAGRLGLEARRRVASARALTPEKPLFLYVDLAETPRDAQRLDDELGTLLDFLADLELEDHTRVGVVWREIAPDGSLRARALLRPEPGARSPRGVAVEMPVLADEMAAVMAGLLPVDAAGVPLEAGATGAPGTAP